MGLYGDDGKENVNYYNGGYMKFEVSVQGSGFRVEDLGRRVCLGLLDWDCRV